MPPYAFTPVSWNGLSIQGGNYTSYFEVANGPLSTRPYRAVEATITGLGDRDVRGQPGGETWELRVDLAAVNQTDLAAFHQVFSEEAGTAYLRVTDGAGVTWRVAARVLRIRALNVRQFAVVLRVANPTWEAETLSTDSKLNQTVSPIALALTNSGTRRARPKFTLTPDVAKSTMLDDYQLSLRGFVVNRAAAVYNDLPMYLFDQLGTQQRLDTAALILDGSKSNLVNNAAGITASATVIDIDTPVGGGLPAPSGMAQIDAEQLYYTGNSGTQLTGCVRGIGGTAAAAHADNAGVVWSKALKNGDDVGVWLNDSPVDRWLVNWNTAASDVVINVTLPPRIKLTPARAGLSTDTSIEFVEGVDELPPSGYLARVPETLAQSEVLHYSGKSGKSVTGCTRGVWDTLAGGFAAGASFYANPIPYVVGLSKAKATDPLADARRRPAIQLPGSQNTEWRYGNTSDDPSTIFFDPARPDRTAQWRPDYDDDGNAKLLPLVTISESKSALTFKDTDAGEANLPYNFAELTLPQSARYSGTSPITMDWTPAAEVLNLELWARDASGTEKLLDQLQQTAAAPGRTYDLTSPTYALKLKGRYNVATGHRGTGSTAIAVQPAGPNLAYGQRFVLDKRTTIQHITLMLHLASAGSQNYFVQLRRDASGLPDQTTPGYLWSGSYTLTNTAAALTKHTPETPVTLDAGTYWVVVQKNSPDSINIIWTSRADYGRYPRGAMAYYVSPTWTAYPDAHRAYFLITSGYDNEAVAPINSEQPVRAVTTALRSELTASFDNVIIPIQGSIADSPKTAPYASRSSGFNTNLFHRSGVLTFTTIGKTIAIDKWCRVANSSLVIDCEKRQVLYTEGGLTTPVPKAIAPSDFADWGYLNPGANALSYAETDLGQTDFVTEWRAAKA